VSIEPWRLPWHIRAVRLPHLSLRLRRWSAPLLLLAAPAVAKPPVMIDLTEKPSNPQFLATQLEKTKPGKAYDELEWRLIDQVREKGTELTDPDALDAMTELMLQRIFDEMAAPTDIFRWDGDDSPRGDVLLREKLKLLPGRNSSGFLKSFTVAPDGKRIDRAYARQKLTVEVSVAKSEAEWQAWVETKGWGAALHPVLVNDGVAVVALTLLSPGKKDFPSPHHERPVWVAVFRKVKAGAPWEQLIFDSVQSKDQKLQETNLITPGPPGKWTEPQRKLVLALRLEDVRLLNNAHLTFLGQDAKWFSLDGLTDAPVDARHVGWLDDARMSEQPLVRAAAALKAYSLGGTVTAQELADVLTQVRVVQVQEKAQAALLKLLDASTDAVPEADAAALRKLGGGDDVKLQRDVARVRAGDSVRLFLRGASGWAPLVPKK
jgi:uncharacterized protein (DUF1778 family)